MNAEIEQLKQEKQQFVDKYLDERNAKEKLEKSMKRLKNGVCPCCKRSFKGLHAHLKKQHPDYYAKLSK